MRDDPETPESSDFEIPAVDETYDRKSYLYFQNHIKSFGRDPVRYRIEFNRVKDVVPPE